MVENRADDLAVLRAGVRILAACVPAARSASAATLKTLEKMVPETASNLCLNQLK